MANKWLGLPLLGGLCAGIAASLCCVGPLALLMLGIGGAWVSGLTTLEPYRPLFIVLALLALGVAYQKIFLVRSREACEDGKVCARPVVKRGYRLGFWLVTAVVSLSVASPYAIPLFY